MAEYLQALSPLSLLLLWLLAGLLPAIVMLMFVRRFRSVERLRREHDVVAATFTVIGGLYAVLLAFLVMTVATQFSNTLAVCEQEGNALANLHRDSYGLRPAYQIHVRQALIAYARVVIADEWPELKFHRDSLKATEAMNRIWEQFRGIEPGTEREKIWLQESVARLNELASLRRLRILASQDTLSWVLWMLLIVGGIITIGFMNFFGVERLRSHLILTLSLVGLILLTLFIIYSFDNPFWGDPHISPTAFLRFLARHPTPE
ncbi:MAG: DUF4239 domain-containing protein [Kiritimatiellaeota bacterium]|nr:DUF4239 domain-containing protein [Kiritimatiellota bacterium]